MEPKVRGRCEKGHQAGAGSHLTNLLHFTLRIHPLHFMRRAHSLLLQRLPACCRDTAATASAPRPATCSWLLSSGGAGTDATVAPSQPEGDSLPSCSGRSDWWPHGSGRMHADSPWPWALEAAECSRDRRGMSLNGSSSTSWTSICRIGAPCAGPSVHLRWFSAAAASQAQKSKRGGSGGKGPSAAAIALVEQGLVSAGSRILQHHKRNIDRPQLTARLMKRRDVVELRDMIRVHSLPAGRGLDPLHIAASLNRLGQLLKRANGGSEADQATARACVELLVPSMQRACGLREATQGKGGFQPRFKVDSACGVLWALAKLPSNVRTPADSAVLDQVIQRATRNALSLHGSSPTTIATLVWALSKLSALAEEEGAGSLPPPPPPRPSPAAVAAAVDAVLASTLSPARTSSYLKQCSPAVLALLCSGLASLQRLDAPTAQALASEVSRRLPNLAFKPFESRDLVGVVQGMARAGHGRLVPELFGSVAAHVCGPLVAPRLVHARHWKPQHLSHLAAAFAEARIKHDGLFAALSAACQPRLAQFEGWAITELRNAYQALGYDAPWLLPPS
jgi:hypothetical protein